MTNGNPTQTIVIVVDDSAVAAANARTKKAFADQAQSGVTSYKQIGDASSSTTDLVVANTNRQISAHQRNIQAVNQVASAHLRLHQILARTLELAASAAAAAGSVAAYGSGAAAGAAPLGLSFAGVENAYRVTRLSLSPTPFTAASLVAGAVAQYSVVQASRQGNFINQQAMVSARAGFGKDLDIDDAQRLAQAANFSGQNSNYYQNMYADLRKSIGSGSSSSQAALNTIGFTGTTTPTVDDLQNIGKALNAIVDPAQRARVALALFPTTASEAMRTLGRDFDYTNNAVDRFNTLIGSDAAQNIAKFKDNIEDVKSGFRELGQFVGAIEQKINGFFANIAAYIGNYALDVVKAPVGVLADLDMLITGKENGTTALAIATAPGDVRLRNNIVNADSRMRVLDSQAAVLGPDAQRIAGQLANTDDVRQELLDRAKERQTDALLRYRKSLTTMDSDSVGAHGTGKVDSQAIIDLVSATRDVATFSDNKADLSRPLAQLSKRISDLSLNEGTPVFRAIQSARAYVNKDGDTTMLDLSAKDRTAAMRAYFDEFRKLQRNAAKEAVQQIQEEFQTRLNYDTQLFEDRKNKENAIYQLQRETSEKIYGGERDENSLANTLAMGNLDLTGVDGKDRVLAELALKNKFSGQTAALDIEQIARKQRQDLADAGFTDADLAATSIDNGGVRDQLRGAIIASSGADAQAVQRRYTGEQLTNSQQAAIALANQSRDQIQKDFEAVKDAAGQVLDSLFDRGSNVFKSLANVLKNALLNALKEGLSNQIAGAFTNAIHGPGAVTFESAQGGGGLLGMLGLPATPKFSAIGGVPTGGSGGDPGVQIVRDSQGGDNSWSGSSGGALAGVPGFPVGAVNLLAALNPMAAVGGTADLGGGAIGSSSTGMIGGYGGGSASTAGTYGVTVDGSAGGASTAGVAGVTAARDAVFGSTVSGTATGHGSGGLLSSVTGGGGTGPGGIISRISQLKSLFYNSGSIALKSGVSTTAAGVSQAAGGGVLGAIAGGAAGFVASPAAGSLGLSLGLSGLEAKRQNLGTSAKTVGGFGLAGASIGASTGFGMAGGALVGVGVGLTADGIKRGGFAGLGEDAAGGAAVGFEFGGPFGAAIGAVAGAAIGFGRLFVTTDLQHTIKLAQQLYHLTISQDLAQQIDQIAKQSFGGQISVAMRSKPVLDLLTLYAQATGQKFGVQNVERPYFLTETTKGVQQQAFYVDGSAYSYNSPLSVYGGVATTQLNPYIQGNQTVKLPGQGNYANVPTSSPASFQLDPDSTQAFLSGQAVQFVNGNPRVITDANQDAQSGGYGRLSSAALLLSPTLLT